MLTELEGLTNRVHAVERWKSREKSSNDRVSHGTLTFSRWSSGFRQRSLRSLGLRLVYYYEYFLATYHKLFDVNIEIKFMNVWFILGPLATNDLFEWHSETFCSGIILSFIWYSLLVIKIIIYRISSTYYWFFYRMKNLSYVNTVSRILLLVNLLVMAISCFKDFSFRF